MAVGVILFVDDSAEDSFFVRRVLKKTCPDRTVYEFTYAEEALHFLRSPGRPPVDLALVDIAMPRMDGFEFVELYSNLYPELRGAARLFIMSSSLDPSDQARALAHPIISGYVKKPLTPEVLHELLDTPD